MPLPKLPMFIHRDEYLKQEQENQQLKTQNQGIIKELEASREREREIWGSVMN
jgi:hypothetical protein